MIVSKTPDNPYATRVTEVQRCNKCGKTVTTVHITPEKVCDVLPDSYGSRSVDYNKRILLVVQINLPSDLTGAEVYIGGHKAAKTGNNYAVDLDSVSSDTKCLVEIKVAGETIEKSELTINVDSGFFARFISWFANFLFNGFKWKTETLSF